MKTKSGYETNGDYVKINVLDDIYIIETEIDSVLFSDEQQADQYIHKLLNPKNKCKICGKDFEPNKYRKDQRFCGKEGMSKRFYAACQIAPSVISSMLSSLESMESLRKVMKDTNSTQEKVIIRMSYEYADELLKQENE